jgi:hypothetical protein
MFFVALPWRRRCYDVVDRSVTVLMDCGRVLLLRSGLLVWSFVRVISVLRTVRTVANVLGTVQFIYSMRTVQVSTMYVLTVQ